MSATSGTERWVAYIALSGLGGQALPQSRPAGPLAWAEVGHPCGAKSLVSPLQGSGARRSLNPALRDRWPGLRWVTPAGLSTEGKTPQAGAEC